jgi:hypothetical protein
VLTVLISGLHYGNTGLKLKNLAEGVCTAVRWTVLVKNDQFPRPRTGTKYLGWHQYASQELR